MEATKDNNMKSQAVKALFWRFFEQGGAAIVTLVVQVVMTRHLDPASIGALALIQVFVNIGNVIVQSGLNTAIIQDPDVTDRDYDTVFWMSLALSLVLLQPPLQHLSLVCRNPRILEHALRQEPEFVMHFL